MALLRWFSLVMLLYTIQIQTRFVIRFPRHCALRVDVGNPYYDDDSCVCFSLNRYHQNHFLQIGVVCEKRNTLRIKKQ